MAGSLYTMNEMIFETLLKRQWFVVYQVISFSSFCEILTLLKKLELVVFQATFEMKWELVVYEEAFYLS